MTADQKTKRLGRGRHQEERLVGVSLMICLKSYVRRDHRPDLDAVKNL